MGSLGDAESVLLRQQGIVFVSTRFFQRVRELLVVHITEALIEEEREDELFVVTGVDIAPQEGCGAPEIRFKLRL
jgi:hypothetical protein